MNLLRKMWRLLYLAAPVAAVVFLPSTANAIMTVPLLKIV